MSERALRQHRNNGPASAALADEDTDPDAATTTTTTEIDLDQKNDSSPSAVARRRSSIADERGTSHRSELDGDGDGEGDGGEGGDGGGFGRVLLNAITTMRPSKITRAAAGIVPEMFGTEGVGGGGFGGSGSAAMSMSASIDTTKKRLCSRCRTTGRVGKFRPLVGEGGDFICDGCYRDLFPATAMVDDGAAAADDVRIAAGQAVRKGVAALNRGVGGAIRSAAGRAAKVVGTNAEGGDIWDRECAEVMMAAVEEEEEECRMCLEPGTVRPCCKSYYCHECYFRSKACPRCGAVVHLTGIGKRRRGGSNKGFNEEDPGKLAVGLSWALSLSTAASSVAITLAVVWNDRTSPVTVWGHRCHGWFPSCDIEACVDAGIVTSERGSSSSEVLGMPWGYRPCSLSSTVGKVVGKACLYDGQLFDRTGGVLGYDFCLSAPREARRGMDGGSSVSFQEGAYIFEDDFDRWSALLSGDGEVESEEGKTKTVIDPTRRFTIGMASAVWSEMINADVSDACGVYSTVHNSTRPYLFIDDDKDGSAGALVFSGVHFRHAITTSLDVQHGGHVEFHIKFAPVTPNEEAATCKTAYGGDAALSYSTDEGISWTIFGTYPVYLYRNPHFSAVKETIPLGAWSNRTQFRWSQPSFDPLRDWWALDDVRIFRRFRQGWKDSPSFEHDRETRLGFVRYAQCSVDTEMCQLFPNGKSSFFKEEEKGKDESDSNTFLDFDGNRQFRFKSYEIFVYGAALAMFGRMAYDSLVRKISSPKHDFQSLATRPPLPNAEERRTTLFARHQFSHHMDKSWQEVNMVLLIGPLLFAVWRQVATYIVSASEGRGPDAIDIFLSVIAFALDSISVAYLLKRVFRVAQIFRWRALATSSSAEVNSDANVPMQLLSTVEVDTDPDRSYLRVGTQFISLSDVVDIEPIAASFCYALHFCFLLGGMPYASACILFRTYLTSPGWSFGVVRVATRIVGTVAVARSIAGRPVIFVQACLGLEWLCKTSTVDRGDVGWALKRRGVVETVWYSTVIAMIFSVFVVVCSGDDIKRGKGVLILGGTAMGTLLGSLMGTMRDLPVDPHVILTRWPTRGHCVVYLDKVRCPCLFKFAYCSHMHSRRRLLILYLDDMFAFRSMLRGEVKGIVTNANAEM